MGKRILFLMIMLMLVFALSGVSYAWQGRMGGMEDPFGLVADESDYLIHPAKIANGEGVRFYGNYRFLYTGVLDWDNELDIFNTAGVLGAVYPREGSGNEQRNEVLVGSSFPVWLGRMGLFFTYKGMRGINDGTMPEYGPPFVLPDYFDTYQLKSDLDNFALRLLYGLPIGGGFKLGGEVQLAYCQEENRELLNFDFDGAGTRWLYTNYFGGGIGYYQNLFTLMLPYDSKYWEALFKGSLEGKVGPLDLEFTLRAGFPFSGDNTYEYQQQAPIGTLTQALRLGGDVTGWRIGGDLWARYLLKDGLTLPFLVRVDYQAKTRDGMAPGGLGFTQTNFTAKSQEQSLGITAGGGLDKELAKGARIAGGIYYNYLQGNNDLQITWSDPRMGSINLNYSDIPASIEHQVMLRLAGELALSPVVTLRMGLAPFFGWVRQDFKDSYINDSLTAYYTDDISMNGYHWGIGASLGGTIQFKPITLEPFINAGYQQLRLKGDGGQVDIPSGALIGLFDMSKDRNEWSIGGGLSILYDL